MKNKLTMLELTVLCWFYKEREPATIPAPREVSVVSTVGTIQRLKEWGLLEAVILGSGKHYALTQRKFYKLTSDGRKIAKLELRLLGHQLSYLRSLIG